MRIGIAAIGVVVVGTAGIRGVVIPAGGIRGMISGAVDAAVVGAVVVSSAGAVVGTAVIAGSTPTVERNHWWRGINGRSVIGTAVTGRQDECNSDYETCGEKGAKKVHRVEEFRLISGRKLSARP
jgi:hypothetical protein